MKVAVDGAAIYVCFPQAGWGAAIRGNLIHDLRRNPSNPRDAGPWSAAGIYLDGVRARLGMSRLSVRRKRGVPDRTAAVLLPMQRARQCLARQCLLPGQVTPPQEVLERIQAKAGPRRSGRSARRVRGEGGMGRPESPVRQGRRRAALSPSAYDGKPSGNLLPRWQRTIKDTKLDDQRTQHSLTLDRSSVRLGDPLRGCRVPGLSHGRVDAAFPEHRSQATPLIAGIQALDVKLEREQGSRVRPAPPHRRQLLGAKLRAARDAARRRFPARLSRRPAAGRPTAPIPTSTSTMTAAA